MERIDKCTTTKFRRKTNRNTRSTRKSTRNLTSKDNLAGYSDKPSDITEPYFTNVWVKQEIDLGQDQVELTIIEGRTIDNVGLGIEDCHNDGERTTSNFNTNHNIVNDEHSREYVIPDHVSNENETTPVNVLEKQLEMCKARNFELEEIVNKQKIEIKQLRILHKNCFCAKEFQKDTQKRYRVGDFGEYETFCPVCRKDLKTIGRKYDRERHLRTCRDGSKFRCTFCKVTYSRKYELTKHVQKCEAKK